MKITFPDGTVMVVVPPTGAELIIDQRDEAVVLCYEKDGQLMNICMWPGGMYDCCFNGSDDSVERDLPSGNPGPDRQMCHEGWPKRHDRRFVGCTCLKG